MKKHALWIAAAAAITCATPAPGEEVAQIVSPLSHPNHPLMPKNATPHQCFAHDVTPAIIETVTRKTELTPARVAVDIETGQTEIVRPATYKTDTVQEVIREREDLFFETVCPQFYTERFVKSLQRALHARGFYVKQPSGWFDAETQLGIRLYQKQSGLNSKMLSLKTVEAFGLVTHSDFRTLTDN